MNFDEMIVEPPAGCKNIYRWVFEDLLPDHVDEFIMAWWNFNTSKYNVYTYKRLDKHMFASTLYVGDFSSFVDAVKAITVATAYFGTDMPIYISKPTTNKWISINKFTTEDLLELVLQWG